MMHIYCKRSGAKYELCAVQAQVSFRSDFNEMIYLLKYHGLHLAPWRLAFLLLTSSPLRGFHSIQSFSLVQQ